ncbi:TlpA family protein disulfide reductase [Rufibacter roseus]|uniref:TlpA family protein disulfide reductase n=2 Tax=Rufibacter roseus TaxID=1567108 RepID=A0ABW2DEW6_9BACT|nr:TlpA disulfide reductase family protein [Rufibacter roseus]
MIIILALTLQSLQAQSDKVTVSGKIVNSTGVNGSYVYLVTGGSAETVQFNRGPINNNSFTIQLRQDYQDSLVNAFLFISPLPKMDDKIYKENLKNVKRHRILIDTAEIQVNIDNAAKWARVKGGELNRHKREFDLVDSTYHAMYKQKRVDEQYVHSGNFLDDLNRYRNLATVELIKKYNNSLVSLSMASSLANLPVPRMTYEYRNEIRDALDSFSPALKASAQMQKIETSFADKVKRDAPKDGLPFPNVEMVNQDLKPVSLYDLYGGKEYVLLDFWATWCGPCIQQQPTVKMLAEKFKDSNVQIVGVSVDQKQPAWSNYLKKKPFNYPQYHFNPADKEMLANMGAMKLPTYTLVEISSGKIVEYDIPINELEKTLEKYRK